MLPKFTIQRVEQIITFADDSEDYTDEYDAGPVEPADFRDALDALNSNCWDYIDERGDGTIICYPTDFHQDMYTGAWESTQVIVKARRSEWADRLASCYRAQS